MLKRIFCSTLFFIVFGNASIAQTCLHKNLSVSYDYRITANKTKDEDDILKVKEIIVEVLNKSSNKIQQRIIIIPDEFSLGEFSDCKFTRSYITGINKKGEAIDGDYGDFIVADFNFDGKEDFAVKIGQGASNGSHYKFLTKRKNGTFKNDIFLSESVVNFPDSIDPKTKTLSTFIHANVNGYNENVYKYNLVAEKWVKIKTKYHKN